MQVTARRSLRSVAVGELIHASINRGEITVDEEFPPTRVTAEEITASVPKTKAAKAPQHTGHEPGALDSDCPACAAESVAADREANQ